MKTIYEQKETAFKGMSAYVITHKGKMIGNVAFKRGNCRVTCYMHIHGLAMTKGIANGGGYDMASAAIYNAIKKTKGSKDSAVSHHAAIIAEVLKDDGQHWDAALTKAGYEVMGAV